MLTSEAKACPQRGSQKDSDDGNAQQGLHRALFGFKESKELGKNVKMSLSFSCWVKRKPNSVATRESSEQLTAEPPSPMGYPSAQQKPKRPTHDELQVVKGALNVPWRQSKGQRGYLASKVGTVLEAKRTFSGFSKAY